MTRYASRLQKPRFCDTDMTVRVTLGGLAMTVRVTLAAYAEGGGGG